MVSDRGGRTPSQKGFEVTTPIPAHAYAVLALPFAAAWIGFFVVRPSLRKPMAAFGALAGLAGPISEFWHRGDYWHPGSLLPVTLGLWRFGPEDYFLSFALAGIALCLFEILAGKPGRGPLPPLKWKTIRRLDGWGNIGIACMALLVYALGMNSIYAMLCTLAACSGLLLWKRPEARIPALAAAGIFSLFYWIVFKFFFLALFPRILGQWWNLDALWGIGIAGVPAEELLWAFLLALFAGPVVRACSPAEARPVS